LRRRERSGTRPRRRSAAYVPDPPALEHPNELPAIWPPRLTSNWVREDCAVLPRKSVAVACAK